MMTPDVMNAIFEMMGGLFVLLNIRRLQKDNMFRGVDWRVMAFFTIWGFWNIFYYSHLEQWWSFIAGIFLVLANTVYVALLVYYIRLEKRYQKEWAKLGWED